MLRNIFCLFHNKELPKRAVLYLENKNRDFVSSLPNKCSCYLSKTIMFYVTLDIAPLIYYRHINRKKRLNVLTLIAVFSFLSTFVCFRFTIYSHFCSKLARKDKNDQISYSRKLSDVLSFRFYGKCFFYQIIPQFFY